MSIQLIAILEKPNVEAWVLPIKAHTQKLMNFGVSHVENQKKVGQVSDSSLFVSQQSRWKSF